MTNFSNINSRVSFRAWLYVAMLSVVGCLNYMDRTMITTMRSSILQTMPMTDAQFGLLTSVFLWVYGIISPFAGYMADRFNRSKVIIISLFIWSGVTWLTAHASTFNELLATRALMGISEACYIPAALALITDYHRGPTRSLATGIHMGGIMIGQSLGFVGGWIAENHHWTYAFQIFGIIGIIYAVILALVLKDNKKNDPAINAVTEAPRKVNFKQAIIDLFSKRSFLLALLFWSLLGVVGWMTVGWLPTYYKEHFKLSQTVAGWYATGYTYSAALVGVIVGGVLADRWSRSTPRARIWVPVIGLCIAAPCIFFAGNTGVLAVAIGGFMAFAFMRSFSDANMMPILCLVADPRYRATGYGVLNFVSCIVGGLGLYGAGMLRDAAINLGTLFQFASVVIIICALVLFMVKPQVKEV
jgi:MFS family permease